MRAQTLSDAADSKSALAPLLRVFLTVSDNRNNGDTPEPSILDGVGITPQPQIDAPTSLQPADPVPSRDFGVQQLFTRAYALVSAALLLSAFISSQVPTPEPDQLLANQATLQFLFFFEIACVALLSRYVARLPRNLAAVALFVVAATNGASFTVFLAWVPPAALAYGFLMCGVSFALTALIADRKNIDLSSSRGILLLFATGTALIVLFTGALRLDVHYWETSLSGFVLFAALASYFCDDIASLDGDFEDDRSGWKSAICGALVLYLNFINLYLILSRMVAWAISQSKKD
jgi:uncharacterized protein